MAGDTGFEPVTSPLERVRSNQLSQSPCKSCGLAETVKELLLLKSVRRKVNLYTKKLIRNLLCFDETIIPHMVLIVKWSLGDSNSSPPPCKRGALPTELRPQHRKRKLPGGCGRCILTIRKIHDSFLHFLQRVLGVFLCYLHNDYPYGVKDTNVSGRI